MYHRMLLALDGSEASDKEVAYVAEMTAKRDDLYFHLVHVLPPRTIAEDEERQDAARKTLERLRARLVGNGTPPERVDIGTLQSQSDASLVDGLLDAARDQQCDTIVVGRNSLPWHRDLLHHHPADELVRKAQGFAVWVVE